MPSPDTTRGSVRRALLIGINAYANKPLDGCIADAELMAEVLQERFGFKHDDITLLRDRGASREAVLAALDALVASTQAEDAAFIFYAGHGSYATTDDQTEAAGTDSTLNVCEKPREDIYDHELRARLEALATRTPHTVVILDCCHSGTMTRDGSAPPRGERWSKPVRNTTRPAMDRGPHTDGSATRSTKGDPSDSYVFIAACLDHEIAKESAIPGDDATHHGALTYALVQELRRAAPGETWRDVFERVSRTIRTIHEDQHPQIEGAQERMLFGLTEFAPAPYVTVTARHRTRVTLGAGALQGLRVGAAYTVYPDGSKGDGSDTPLGRLEVTLVKGTTAMARILSENTEGDIDTGCRARTAERGTVAEALALENRNRASGLRGAVTLEVLRAGPDERFTPADDDAAVGMPVFDSTERIAFRITNTTDVPVYVNLFDFDPRGSVGALTKGSANLLIGNSNVEIGVADLRKLRVVWDGDDAVTSYKLFASVKPVDLTYLTQLEQQAVTTRGGQITDDDWTTVTTQVMLRRKAMLSADEGVNIAGASITTRGMTAAVRSATGGPDATRRLAPSGALAQALADMQMQTQQSFVITDAQATTDGTRSTDGEPTLQVQVVDPGDGYAQVAMTTDESGMIQWHFPPELDDEPVTRGDAMPTIRTRTFTFDTRRVDGTGERGVLSAIAQKLINVYVFPVGKAIVGHVAAKYGEKLELERTPYRVRTFLPGDYATKQATTITGGAWSTLAAGRALLMIHGTNSSTHTAFGELPPAFVDAMHAQYEGRVFAFDHPTLTHDPRQNIETLLDLVPDGITLDVDIICHSRGGLVSRVLAEKQESLQFGTRTLRVGTVIFVGAPNAGTRLADEACIGEYLDTVTNLLNVVPTNGATDALGFVLTGVKLVATGLWSGLKGLHSMQPGGEFGTWLNTGERAKETRYFALASNYTPTQPSLVQLVKDRLMDKVFKGSGNDLVVPTDGVFAANGSGYFPIEGEVVFGAADGVPHTGFFQYARTATQMETWLKS